MVKKREDVIMHTMIDLCMLHHEYINGMATNCIQCVFVTTAQQIR